MIQYGLPYRGSKSSIAEQIVSALPKRRIFIDGCCGGCAVTHAAVRSRKFEIYKANDINKRLINALVWASCRATKLDLIECGFIGRDEFMKSRFNADCDPSTFLKILCCSFGYNGRSYFRGEDESKTANDFAVAAFSSNYMDRVEALVRISERACKFEKPLRSLGCVNRLIRYVEDTFGQVEYGYTSYTELENQMNLKLGDSVIYLDIPYRGTESYFKTKFDYDALGRFVKQMSAVEVPVFISEYSTPCENLVQVASFDKRKIMGATTNSGTIDGLEKLYFNGSVEQYRRLMEVQ